MFECIILGDSIAVGTHQAKTECVAYAQGGISSYQWNRKYNHTNLEAKIVVISLGSNDSTAIHTEQELRTLRNRITSAHVMWIVPNVKPYIQQIVKMLAREYGDSAIPIKHSSPDGIHPTVPEYKSIARAIQ